MLQESESGWRRLVWVTVYQASQRYSLPTSAHVIKKAKHVLAWGESGKGGEFWNPVENDGMIPLGGDIDDEYGENLEDYNDKTDKYRTEPKRSTDGIEVASATNGQGDYGNMSMCIQKVALP